MDQSFEQELSALINRHSKENESNTPDFILAQYISGCFDVFNNAVRDRDKWHGYKSEQKFQVYCSNCAWVGIAAINSVCPRCNKGGVQPDQVEP